MHERFNTVAVNLPIQDFFVRCHVSVERQVPVMTEFAVRLLNAVDGLTVEAFSTYFGIRGHEVNDMLAILREEGLVQEAEEGFLSLTSYAKARFVTSDDGVPRFTRIVERRTRTAFELCFFTPVPPRASGPYWDNTYELDWSAGQEAVGNTIDRATEAFHRHFQEIERLSKRDEDKRAFSVYKVEEISAGKRANLPVPVHFTIDPRGGVDYSVDDQGFLSEELKSRIVQLAAARIGQLRPYMDRFAEFAADFDDEVLGRYLSPPSTSDAPGTASSGFRFSDYVREVHATGESSGYDTGQSQALLGALYMDANREKALAALRRGLRSVKETDDSERKLPTEIFWVVPDSELWGRTELLRDTVNALKRAVETEWDRTVDVIAVYPAPQAERRERLLRTTHLLLEAGFSEVLFGPASPGTERFELLLLPGVHMIALYHASAAESAVGVPIGFSSTNRRKLSGALAFLRKVCSLKLHRGSRGGENGERQVNLTEVSPGDFLYISNFEALGTVGKAKSITPSTE